MGNRAPGRRGQLELERSLGSWDGVAAQICLRGAERESGGMATTREGMHKPRTMGPTPQYWGLPLGQHDWGTQRSRSAGTAGG